MSQYLLNAKTASYTTSQDADLFRRLAIAFSMQPRDGWRDIQIIVRHGLVTLIGEVATFRSRQILVAVARHVAGVLRVRDEIQVVEVPTRKGESSAPVPTSPVGGRVDSKAGIVPNSFVDVPATAQPLEEIVAASR